MFKDCVKHAKDSSKPDSKILVEAMEGAKKAQVLSHLNLIYTRAICYMPQFWQIAKNQVFMVDRRDHISQCLGKRKYSFITAQEAGTNIGFTLCAAVEFLTSFRIRPHIGFTLGAWFSLDKEKLAMTKTYGR